MAAICAGASAGRSDWMRLLGVSHEELFAGVNGSPPLMFIVRNMDMKFKRPAKIDEDLARGQLHQRMVGSQYHHAPGHQTRRHLANARLRAGRADLGQGQATAPAKTSGQNIWLYITKGQHS